MSSTLSSRKDEDGRTLLHIAARLYAPPRCAKEDLFSTVIYGAHPSNRRPRRR